MREHFAEAISSTQARKIILHAQNLTKEIPFGASSSSVAKAIEHLGYVQIDTISVVERAHHHVLWTRIPAYKTLWLDEAQYKTRRVFEYWAHAAAYLPMKDFRFSLPVMKSFRDKKDRWPASSKSDMKKVLSRIKDDGPLMARNFESSHKGGSWWDWKPDKWALQRLFLEGHLMVSHREGFQRIYDLPERILPEGTNTTPPTEEEYYRYLINTTLLAQGLATRNEISHLRQTNVKIFEKVLRHMQEENLIIPVQVDAGKIYYTLPDYLDKQIRLPDKVTIFSPFDNLIIWRKRISDIFDFDYTLECYIPSPKRQFGYFCLPVLHKDQFAGRIDCKADRKNKILLVSKEHWTSSKQSLDFKKQYKDTLKKFAAFNGCALPLNPLKGN